MPVDQVHQVGVLLGLLDEGVPHQLLGRGPVLGVLVEAGLHELLELLGEVAGELRRVVLGDEEEHSHGVQVGVGGLALGEGRGQEGGRESWIKWRKKGECDALLPILEETLQI